MTDTQPVVTQEDIEAVAIALCKEKFAEQELCNPYWGPDKFGPPDTIAIAEIDKNFYRRLARAAIAAHRTASTAALQKQLDMAVAALEAARAQFAFYAKSHAKKNTPEGDAKAGTNLEFANRMAEALAAIKEQGA